MSLSKARARVFGAGGHCFTRVEVVEWARARSEWAALGQRVGALQPGRSRGALARRSGGHRARLAAGVNRYVNWHERL